MCHPRCLSLVVLPARLQATVARDSGGRGEAWSRPRHDLCGKLRYCGERLGGEEGLPPPGATGTLSGARAAAGRVLPVRCGCGELAAGLPGLRGACGGLPGPCGVAVINPLLSAFQYRLLEGREGTSCPQFGTEAGRAYGRRPPCGAHARPWLPARCARLRPPPLAARGRPWQGPGSATPLAPGPPQRGPDSSSPAAEQARWWVIPGRKVR